MSTILPQFHPHPQTHNLLLQELNDNKPSKLKEIKKEEKIINI
jgi:hypothetical protein